MKRSTFLATILGSIGIGKAQEIDLRNVTAGCSVPHSVFGCGKPVNNQCPVCGEMAPPYKRQMREKNFGALANCKAVPGEPFLMSCDPREMVPDGPAEKVTRCKRCNAAFFQDAE